MDIAALKAQLAANSDRLLVDLLGSRRARAHATGAGAGAAACRTTASSTPGTASRTTRAAIFST